LIRQFHDPEQIQGFLIALRSQWTDNAMTGFEDSGIHDPQLYLRIQSIDPIQNRRYCSLRDTLQRQKGDCKSAAIAAHALLAHTPFSDSYLMGLRSSSQGHEVCLYRYHDRWGTLGTYQTDFTPPSVSSPERAAACLSARYTATGIFRQPLIHYRIKTLNRLCAAYAPFNLRPLMRERQHGPLNQP
ncbi:MAG: hypothetical protein ACOCWQ_05765, partial [Nanoarchaeota archaeon]